MLTNSNTFYECKGYFNMLFIKLFILLDDIIVFLKVPFNRNSKMYV